MRKYKQTAKQKQEILVKNQQKIMRSIEKQDQYKKCFLNHEQYKTQVYGQRNSQYKNSVKIIEDLKEEIRVRKKRFIEVNNFAYNIFDDNSKPIPFVTYAFVSQLCPQGKLQNIVDHLQEDDWKKYCLFFHNREIVLISIQDLRLFRVSLTQISQLQISLDRINSSVSCSSYLKLQQENLFLIIKNNFKNVKIWHSFFQGISICKNQKVSKWSNCSNIKVKKSQIIVQSTQSQNNSFIINNLHQNSRKIKTESSNYQQIATQRLPYQENKFMKKTKRIKTLTQQNKEKFKTSNQSRKFNTSTKLVSNKYSKEDTVDISNNSINKIKDKLNKLVKQEQKGIYWKQNNKQQLIEEKTTSIKQFNFNRPSSQKTNTIPNSRKIVTNQSIEVYSNYQRASQLSLKNNSIKKNRKLLFYPYQGQEQNPKEQNREYAFSNNVLKSEQAINQGSLLNLAKKTLKAVQSLNYQDKKSRKQSGNEKLEELIRAAETNQRKSIQIAAQKQSFNQIQSPNFTKSTQSQKISQILKFLKDGIILWKCSPNSWNPHQKKLFLNENQFEICYCDITNQKQCKNIFLQDIRNILYKRKGKGIIQHFGVVEASRCLLLKIKHKNNLKYLQFYLAESQSIQCLQDFVFKLKKFLMFKTKYYEEQIFD